MGVTTRDLCPFCGTRDVAFQAVFEWQSISGYRSLFICGHCREGVLREVIGSGNIPVVQYSGAASSHGIYLGEQWPKGLSTAAPSDCPDNVARFYEQAVDSLNSGNFDAAGMMFRKSLEAATKSRAPDLGGKSLMHRIDALVNDGVLTKEMGAWAHEIRLAGKDAAHEEEPFSGEEARALHDFAENFLRYSFTLPAAVNRRVSPGQ